MKKATGLGDVAAMVAQPIARAIDGVLGTDLQNCGGCGQRKEAMNAVVPSINLADIFRGK